MLDRVGLSLTRLAKHVNIDSGLDRLRQPARKLIPDVLNPDGVVLPDIQILADDCLRRGHVTHVRQRLVLESVQETLVVELHGQPGPEETHADLTTFVIQPAGRHVDSLRAVAGQPIHIPERRRVDRFILGHHGGATLEVHQPPPQSSCGLAAETGPWRCRIGRVRRDDRFGRPQRRARSLLPAARRRRPRMAPRRAATRRTPTRPRSAHRPTSGMRIHESTDPSAAAFRFRAADPGTRHLAHDQLSSSSAAALVARRRHKWRRSCGRSSSVNRGGSQIDGVPFGPTRPSRRSPG